MAEGGEGRGGGVDGEGGGGGVDGEGGKSLVTVVRFISFTITSALQDTSCTRKRAGPEDDADSLATTSS